MLWETIQLLQRGGGGDVREVGGIQGRSFTKQDDVKDNLLKRQRGEVSLQAHA